MGDSSEYLAEESFFGLVELDGLPPQGTQEGASGLRSGSGPHATQLIERVEQAWRTSYRDLTCEQVRLLLVQKMGLQWLAEPILRFVERYPAAAITNYPGEMSLLSLRAADELLCFAPGSLKAWLGLDFDWLDETFAWSRPLGREARQALAAARTLADQH